MSDAVKWALLGAALIVLIGLILSLPFVGLIDYEELTSSISSLVSVAGEALYNARCIINNFLSPAGRVILSGLLMYLLCKWAIVIGIKVSAWVYHFIFRG